jgi:enoyl-[acyl-carrier-protein] reductase (NADH)
MGHEPRARKRRSRAIPRVSKDISALTARSTSPIVTEPFRRDDVSDAALFLASDEARFITAEILNVDGGAAGKL